MPVSPPTSPRGSVKPSSSGSSFLLPTTPTASTEDDKKKKELERKKKEDEAKKKEEENKKKEIDKKKVALSKREGVFSKSMRFLKGGKTRHYENALADHLKELESDGAASFLLSSVIEAAEMTDIWSSKATVLKDWGEVEADESTVGPEVRNMLDITKSKKEGFCFEFGRNGIIYDDGQVEIEQREKEVEYYKDILAKEAHTTFMSEGEEDAAVGAVIVTFENALEEEEERKAMLRTKKGTERFYIPAKHSLSVKDMLKYVKTEFPELAPLRFTKTVLPELPAKLAEYDMQMVVKRYKFGLLYVKEGQLDENEMFSNVDTSPEYEEFLDFLGQRITLHGWDKYRGGLDVKNNSTGLQSIYTTLEDLEIMFHVSTLLPYQPDDLQRVERKRHLGNDIVCIIFKEGDTPFDPLCLTTHFTNVFIIVQVDKRYKNHTHYKIAIANKIGVPPYGPFLQSPPVYQKSDGFREFFLTKLVNSERASMISPDFKGKMIRTNKQLLSDITKDFIERAASAPRPTRTGDSPEDAVPTSPAPARHAAYNSAAPSPLVQQQPTTVPESVVIQS